MFGAGASGEVGAGEGGVSEGDGGVESGEVGRVEGCGRGGGDFLVFGVGLEVMRVGRDRYPQIDRLSQFIGGWKGLVWLYAYSGRL